MCFLLEIWEYSKFISCFYSIQILSLMTGDICVVAQRKRLLTPL
jgi:hypothetical protein